MLGGSFAETFGDFAAVNFGHLIVGEDGDDERAVEVFVACFLAIETQLFETFAKFGSLFDLFGGEAETERAISKAEFEFGDEGFVVESALGEVVSCGLVFGEKKTLVIVVGDGGEEFGVGGFGIKEAFEWSRFLGFGGDRFATVEQLEGMAEGEAVDSLDELDRVSSRSAAEAMEEAFGRSDDEVGSVLVVVKGTEADEVLGTVFFKFNASGTDKGNKIDLFLEAADFRFRDSGHKRCQIEIYCSIVVI